MSEFSPFKHPYPINEQYSQRTAYFCMEYAIDQALKIYSGGLGYLAGSHMRSAYELKQNLIGIGILWKNGYYDQVRNQDQTMGVLFQERYYNFLQDTGIKFEISVHRSPVKVKVYYLAPDTFGCAPIFFLSTDFDENDYLSRSICHRLYDSNVATKAAQYILLGIGGARLLEILDWEPDNYHFNEAHALPAAYYLYHKLGSIDAVREKLVLTTHTPVPAGNESHNVDLLKGMSFFNDTPLDKVKEISIIENNNLNLTLNSLYFARIANGVSKLHGEVARKMWGNYRDIAPITHITNAQNAKYWADPQLNQALVEDHDAQLLVRKKEMKKRLFEIVADQTGKLYDPDVLTMVWARRFAAYKRADLLLKDMEKFNQLVNNQGRPIQIIWAGKPYPGDHMATEVFNNLVHLSKQYTNIAVLTGYELSLSKTLKQGADVWLNTPRVTREASGTSGMTAAMNGAVNLSTQDGWIPEFGKDGINSFLIPVVDLQLPQHEQDWNDLISLYDILENKVLPIYYDYPEQWLNITKNSMRDVVPYFDSNRMADQYYQLMYQSQLVEA